MVRRTAFRAGVVSAAAAATLMIPVSPVAAAVGISGSLTMPAGMSVGQTGLSGSFGVTNTNSAPNETESNTVTSIRLAPSCGALPTAANLCPTPDPGVFSIGTTAAGRAGSACAGVTFSVSAPDVSGIVTFTPSSPVVVLPGATCRVDFTFSVLDRPTIDVDPPTAGSQTRVNLHIAAQSPGGAIVNTRPSLVVTVVGTRPATAADFDGDGDTDISIYRPSTGGWYIEGKNPVFHGISGDIPVPGNYDGDTDVDIAVFRPAQGGWYVLGGSPIFLGLSGDIPVPANYDGGGNDDIAVFRPSVGAWYVQGQSAVFHGLSGDIPVPGDYDGDGDDDFAVFRPSVGGWYVQGQGPVFFGLSGDVPVPADYDGDGDDDFAVFRPSIGGWYVQGQGTVFLGLNGDIPVPGNYDADAAYERAVFRRTTGAWFIQGGSTQFLGGTGDVPLPLPNAIYRHFTFAGG